MVGQGGSSTDNSVGNQGTTESNPDVPDFDINVIGGQ